MGMWLQALWSPLLQHVAREKENAKLNGREGAGAGGLVENLGDALRYGTGAVKGECTMSIVVMSLRC
jgi:hypothetical protein